MAISFPLGILIQKGLIADKYKRNGVNLLLPEIVMGKCGELMTGLRIIFIFSVA
jgi:hypothetical protein